MKTKLFLQFYLFLSFGYSQKSQFITEDDQTIHFRTYGKGKPILIINGGPGMNSDGFQYIAEKIASLGYQTIIYDQRGNGKSTLKKVDSSSITMGLMVEDIEKIRTHLKLKKWSVMGQSFGGILASVYLEKYPNRVDKVIFTASGGLSLNFMKTIGAKINENLTKQERDSLNFYNNKMALQPNNIDFIKKRAHYLAKAYVFDKSIASKVESRITQVNFKVNELVFKDLNKMQYDYTQKFKNFKHPVIVFQGKNDVITVETAQEIHESFPNSKLVLIDNCAHFAWFDQPTIFFDHLIKFLKASK